MFEIKTKLMRLLPINYDWFLKEFIRCKNSIGLELIKKNVHSLAWNILILINEQISFKLLK